MAKKNSTNPNKKSLSFSDLNTALSVFSPDGAILEDSVYARIDEWIPTGNYILNAALSGSLFGGMPNRRSLTFAGEEGTGKTYLALSIVRHAQAMGYDIVYYDSEGAIDIDFVKRLGVDTKRIRIENISTIEEFATNTAKLNEIITNARNEGVTPPKIMVVLDSLGNLSSLKEKADTTSGDNKRDMTKQQAIRRTFRVVGNDFAKNAIPFIICNHVYEKVGSYFPGKEVSGGGGIKYNSSIIMMLTKSKLEDKTAEDNNKKTGVESTKVGIVITCNPFKQRFARPIKVQIHLPFYKKPNPFVGLEKFISWENCGIVRGKVVYEKEYAKLSESEKKLCSELKANYTEVLSDTAFKKLDTATAKTVTENAQGEKVLTTIVDAYVLPKETSRSLVCRHLKGEIPLIDLYTEKVFTDELLHELDDKVIKKTFMLPSIESLEDLADLTEELDVDEMAEYELGNIVIQDEIQSDEE
jgi:RecA/RadA recombinase